MTMLDKYIYKNCFELNNKNHDINNYLFDASFSNQPITNENDCANYAYYNNHPSFFFQKKNNDGVDVSKCYVYKYENINPNDPDIDKKSQINNITNLNYDLNNNRNLPRYNFTLKDTTESPSGGGDDLDETKCNTAGSLKYYLMKSFSNSYDINYNDIKKRTYKDGISQHINYFILNEYLLKIDSDTEKTNKFNNNYVTLRPYFEHLYHNNIDTTNMYYEMISSFINNTLLYSSINGIGIEIDNILYRKDGRDGSILADNNHRYDGSLNIAHISDITTSTTTTYFDTNVVAYPIFLGLPEKIFNAHYTEISSTSSKNIFKPPDYWEGYIHNYINIIFFIFLIYRLREKAKDKDLAGGSSSSEPKYNELIIELNNVDSSPLNVSVEYDSNKLQNYSFTYFDVLNNLKHVFDVSASYAFEYKSITPEKVSKFFLYLLVYKKRVGFLNKFTDVDEFIVSNKIKTNIYPDIVEKFLSIHNNYDEPIQCFGSFYKLLLGSGFNNANTTKYIKIFKKMYTGEFRFDIIQSFFINRMKQLEDENTIIKNDIANMKTYIDNIYLHSKLNNIENYIYNEKSKLKYLFNKNSSEKQKNDDLNFLNNFVLVENIIICIIIFILILFFIKK
tara:strand:- start:1420 stop:3276 length:1857 start_codon:yes stop_codon:yes gene_type:complete